MYRDDLFAAQERVRVLEKENNELKLQLRLLIGDGIRMIEAVLCPGCGHKLILGYQAISPPVAIVLPPEGP